MMYTSGWPKNQKRCCQRIASPPSAGFRNWVPTSRSIARIMVLAAATHGIANRIMNAVTSIAQTKSGIRASVMPGARSLKVVTMSCTAATSAAISVKVTVCAHTSTRLPGEKSGPERGAYANHPTSTPVFRKKLRYRKMPPIRYT